MKGYSKCECCGKWDINSIVYYSHASLVPMYMCNACLEEFDDAMSEVGTSHDTPWWAEDETY